MDRVTRHILIKGKVQGVNFRAWTSREAKQIELTGWVKNLPSGEVEAVFQGPQKRVDTMLQRVWEGPPAAQVEEVLLLQDREEMPLYEDYLILKG